MAGLEVLEIAQRECHIRRAPALQDMKRWLILLALGGCTAEQLGTTEQDLTKEDLGGDGYTCTKNDPMGASWTCTKCTTVTITDAAGTHNHQVCWSIGCTGHPNGSSECGEESATARSGYWLEAEATNLYGSVQKTADPNASAGSALSMAGGSTRASFATVVDETLYAWARVIAPSASANSVYIQLDGEPLVLWDMPVSTSWSWVRIPNASWSVAAGSHYLRFYTGESGVKIDRVLLIGDPDFVPVAQTIQAETAIVVAPMQLATQHSIPTVGYIYVPNGAGTNGLAQFQVAMPYVDDYFVWGRVLAPSSADNSFSIGELGQPRTTWDLPVSSAWQWRRAPTTLTLGDFDVVEIAEREDGTKLDQLVLTNDPEFTLVESAPPVKTP